MGAVILYFLIGLIVSAVTTLQIHVALDIPGLTSEEVHDCEDEGCTQEPGMLENSLALIATILIWPATLLMLAVIQTITAIRKSKH